MLTKITHVVNTIVQKDQLSFQTTLKKESFVLTVVSSGIVGKRGAAGNEHAVRTSLSAISGHRAVISSGSGLVEYASNNDMTHQYRVLGITTNSASIGADINIQTFGEIVEPSWSFVPGNVFLGTDGNLTQVAPSGINKFSMVIGYAIDATTITVNIQPPITIE